MLPRYTIIDEADEMVSADWVEDMAKIMGGGGKFEDIPSGYDQTLMTFRHERRCRSSLHDVFCHISEGSPCSG